MNVVEQAALMDPGIWSGCIYSGGWRSAAGGDAAVIEPATGQELERVGRANEQDLADAAQRAVAAQRDWAKAGFQERAAVLRRAAGLIEQHGEEIAGWIIRESGSIPPKAQFEVHVATQECYEASTLPSDPLGQIIPSEQPRLSLVRHIPAGVVGVISPFNAPVILSIRSVAPALAVGNAVILKPDPRTAVCGGVMLARVFEEAGLPDGLFHVLPGGPDLGQALVAEPAVRIISFTGSTAAGRQVGEAAARHLKRVHLELGGNSAVIVLDDADLDLAVSAAAFGSFFHQGQICMTTGRHLVHERVAGEYLERLAEKAKHLPVGNPATEQVALGPIIDAGQRDKIHALVTQSVDAGATLAAGGTYEDLFYKATVISDDGGRTPAWSEEVFGPVAPVSRFATVDEALKMANDTPYGLSLGIMTADVMRALELAERIPSGIVHINDQTVNDEAVAPFGGVGESGTGSRVGGALHNIDAFTETQWVTMRGRIGEYPY